MSTPAPTSTDPFFRAETAVESYEQQEAVSFDPRSEEARRFKTRYRPTDEIDELIGDAYRKSRGGDRGALRALGERLQWPRYAICKRGAELGLARTKEQRWSAPEERILHQYGHLSWSGLQRKLADAGFHRSCAAISVKAVRIRLKQNLDGYSASSLATGFGVDVHKVLLWIRKGYLTARRRGTNRLPEQGGDMWWIERAHVKQFVLRFPEEIDLGRVEKFWFLDLITDGKICR